MAAAAAVAADAGVLQFVRGIDLSRNDFSGDRFPHELEQCTAMTWLKLNRTNLQRVPDELSRLAKLEHLQLARNGLQSVHGELSDLPRLRSIIVRNNQIKTSGIPTDIFRMKDLTILDFSNNQLREVPPNLEQAKGAIVLNLAHNNIESIPNAVFANLLDLLFVDLSYNKLEMLPPQIRRITSVQVLKLSHNPLHHFQLKQLPSMTSLRVLHLRSTQRTLDSLPCVLDELVNLADVDLADNSLPAVPDVVLRLKALRKLDLSDNKIEKIRLDETPDAWLELETLNISGNLLSALPEGILRSTKLRRLYAAFNKLTFEGIPSGVGKLLQLEVLHLAHNELELVPEGLSRCVKLQQLRLNHNRLITLPEGLYLLPDLKLLDLNDNPDLVMPPKPAEQRKAPSFYNVDFSLSAHVREGATSSAPAAPHSPASSMSSLSASRASADPVTRRREFIRRRRHMADERSASKVIEGMSQLMAARRQQEEEEETERAERAAAAAAAAADKPAAWREQMEKTRRQLTYADIFDSDIGREPGLTVWDIENFYPALIEQEYYGQFHDADCYVVLHVFRDEKSMTAQQLQHQIYYWLGEHAPLDKGMCAAMHAVGLRNHLSATCRTIRETQNEESDEFLALFGEEIVYIEGARTATGFFQTTKAPHITRLYRSWVHGTSIEMEPVAVTPDSLDPRFVFFLDAEKVLWLWAGRKSKITWANKARLFVERLRQRDRKSTTIEIETVRQGKEPEEFWKALFGKPEPPEDPIVEHVPEDWKPERRKLYEVKIGMGFVELPQVELKNDLARQSLLKTRSVYILDCTSDVFVWFGKAANRLLKMAGQRMATELHAILERPKDARLSREIQGEESTMFKSKFVGWDDIVPVRLQRPDEPGTPGGGGQSQLQPPTQVIKLDVKNNVEKSSPESKMKTDLAQLFLERQQPMTAEESEQMLAECNEDLQLIDAFVLEGKRFVKLPEQEFGVFYSADCYVFLCRYEVFPDEEEEDEEEEEEEEEGPGEEGSDDEDGNKDSQSDGGKSTKKSENGEDAKESDFKCVVYFWQGRDASNMGWFQFTFSMQKMFEKLFKDKLEVVRMHQQQENHKFLAHFRQKFVVKKGRRKNPTVKPVELYEQRANGSLVCTRTIELEGNPTAAQLCSTFTYCLRVKPSSGDAAENNDGCVYVWRGSASEPRIHQVVEDIADTTLNSGDPDGGKWPVKVFDEGKEDDEFWRALGGKRPYDTDKEWYQRLRLFRCTNEKGYFSVSERTVDFCQDDLENEDMMLLDDGKQIFLWYGGAASDVEVKLAYKAAQVYVAHQRMRQPEMGQRRLLLSLRDRESRQFRRCFHAWSRHRRPAGDDIQK